MKIGNYSWLIRQRKEQLTAFAWATKRFVNSGTIKTEGYCTKLWYVFIFIWSCFSSHQHVSFLCCIRYSHAHKHNAIFTISIAFVGFIHFYLAYWLKITHFPLTLAHILTHIRAFCWHTREPYPLGLEPTTTCHNFGFELSAAAENAIRGML